MKAPVSSAYPPSPWCYCCMYAASEVLAFVVSQAAHGGLRMTRGARSPSAAGRRRCSVGFLFVVCTAARIQKRSSLFINNRVGCTRATGPCDGIHPSRRISLKTIRRVPLQLDRFFCSVVLRITPPFPPVISPRWTDRRLRHLAVDAAHDAPGHLHNQAQGDRGA